MKKETILPGDAPFSSRFSSCSSSIFSVSGDEIHQNVSRVLLLFTRKKRKRKEEKRNKTHFRRKKQFAPWNECFNFYDLFDQLMS